MPQFLPDSLLPLEAYARERNAYRSRVIAHKKLRTVHAGDNVMLIFEDEVTIRYQVQEMLRIERIFEADGIRGELKGIEDRTWVEVERCARVFAIADEDLQREDGEKTSAVHFLRFELGQDMRRALQQGRRPVDRRRPPELSRQRRGFSGSAGLARWGSGLRRIAFIAFSLCGLVSPAPAPLFAQSGPARPADELPQRQARERGDAVTGSKSDWEREQEARDFKEGDIALPPPPKDGLIEFPVSSASSFKFFIDPQSLSVGADGVVRYTLVARSPSGAETVSYEGMRCGGQGLYRVYAFAYSGAWSRNASADWRTIEPKSVQRWHNVLRGQFFCPDRYSIQNAAEGLDALRRGAHPTVKNVGSFGGAR